MPFLRDAEGNVIHINMGHSTGRKKKCKFCQRAYREGKLCDFPVAEGKTCDAEMCGSCAVTLGSQETPIGGGLKRIGDTIDVCPHHRSQAVTINGRLQPVAQGNLFEEGR
jgi:hypothetical protein